MRGDVKHAWAATGGSGAGRALDVPGVHVRMFDCMRTRAGRSLHTSPCPRRVVRALFRTSANCSAALVRACSARAMATMPGSGECAPRASAKGGLDSRRPLFARVGWSCSARALASCRARTLHVRLSGELARGHYMLPSVRDPDPHSTIAHLNLPQRAQLPRRGAV
jgi:hypothetical protein